jgi:two-component system response regulator FixJ
MPSEFVHIVDDDADVRNSMAFLLRSAGFGVQTYESAAALLETVSTLRGCIVTDVRMPGMTGLDLQRRLGALGNTLPVIVITGHGDVPLAVEALKAGAVDFIEKPFPPEVILSAVRSAHERYRARTEQDAGKADILAKLASLSPREMQVFEGITAGKSNKEIARDLGISPRTVEVFRANVMLKMQASSLSDAVRMALVGGVLPTSKA